MSIYFSRNIFLIVFKIFILVIYDLVILISIFFFQSQKYELPNLVKSESIISLINIDILQQENYFLKFINIFFRLKNL